VFFLLVGFGLWDTRDLPKTDQIRAQLWSRYHPDARTTWLPLWAISPRLQTAVVNWEDPRFYFHHGFDYPEIWRAFITDLRARAYRTGGSTITQQVAKNLFLTPERSLRRKMREAILTWRLERALSKDEILEVYLNIADWGDGIAGAEAASRAYFKKSAGELTWAESAMLASILANPHRYNPQRQPDQVKIRRQTVLIQLALDQQITLNELRESAAAPCCSQR
jgi:monofunctional biosynthetic peptidoglycan transglycosylase